MISIFNNIPHPEEGSTLVVGWKQALSLSRKDGGLKH